MGWIQKPSAYNYSQQQIAKRRALAQSYLNEQSFLSSAIFAAKDNMSYGMTEIALKALAAKLEGQAKAKIDAGLAQIDEKRAEIAASKSTSTSPLPDDSE